MSHDHSVLKGVQTGAIPSSYQPGLNFVGKGDKVRQGIDKEKYVEGYKEAFGDSYGYKPGDVDHKCQRCHDTFKGSEDAFRCERCAARVRELNG